MFLYFHRAVAAATSRAAQQGVELRESLGLKMRELARALELAEEHRQLIIDK